MTMHLKGPRGLLGGGLAITKEAKVTLHRVRVHKNRMSISDGFCIYQRVITVTKVTHYTDITQIAAEDAIQAQDKRHSWYQKKSKINKEITDESILKMTNSANKCDLFWRIRTI